MRRTVEDYRRELKQGAPTRRLMTLVLMLIVLGLFIARLRDADTWRSWMAADREEVTVAHSASVKSESKTTADAVAKAQPKDTAAATTPPASASNSSATTTSSGSVYPKDSSSDVNPYLPPSGLTDLDPNEIAYMDDDRQAIQDGKTEMASEEMKAYYRCLKWVENQSMEQLRQRARKHVLYDEFRNGANNLRFKIVELNVNVRQIVPVDGRTQTSGKPIYEIRGFTQEGGPHLFLGIVMDVPEGMPIGSSINEQVKLVGYFFKNQGYYSMEQELSRKKNLKPFTAPVIFGRMSWHNPEPVTAHDYPAWMWLAVIGGVIAVAAGGVFFAYGTNRHRPRMRPLTNLDPEGPSVDQWLDQAQSGELILETASDQVVGSDGAEIRNRFTDRCSGNIFLENGESKNRRGASSIDGDPNKGGPDPDVHGPDNHGKDGK